MQLRGRLGIDSESIVLEHNQAQIDPETDLDLTRLVKGSYLINKWYEWQLASRSLAADQWRVGGGPVSLRGPPRKGQESSGAQQLGFAL